MEDGKLFQSEGDGKYKMKTERLSDCMEKQELSWQSEKGELYLCHLWQGVSVWKNEMHMHRLPSEKLTEYPFLKLNYCIAGRCETLLEKGSYVYLEEGDLSIDRNAPRESFCYPSGMYEGLEIELNLEILKQQPVAALTDFGIGMESQERLLEKEDGSFLARVSAEWDVLARHMAKRLRDADGSLAEYRFLALQLLYMLNSGNILTWKRNAYVTKGQRMIAEKMKERLCENLRNHITVEDLAEEFGISPSSLKKYFSLVYGSPVSEYMKNVKMELACSLLLKTKMSVGEVAEEVGYASQGKFGIAFKKHTGQAPLEYRRMK